MENLIKKLKKRGWSDSEIEDLKKVMESGKSSGASRKFSQKDKAFQAHIYWSLIIIFMIANILLVVSLMPAVFIFSQKYLIFLMSFIGFSFGFVLNILIRDLNQIDKKHHLVASIFFPIVSATIVFLSISYASSFSFLLKANLPSTVAKMLYSGQNPFLSTMSFIVAYAVPFLIFECFNLKGFRKEEDSARS